MEKDFSFLIALHFHQPIGNFDSVIEKACDKCYEPFLNTIADFGDIKFNLHYSGCLLEWIKEKRPGLFDKIKKSVKSGQVEIVAGGFYEPILAVLPPEDSAEQIAMHLEFIKKEFGVKAEGAWLTERIWEPHLAQTFADSKIGYTIVDDTHLRYAGLKQEELYGYYITEENNRCLNIFPSDKYLRYGIPFHPQQESIDYFKKIRDEYNRPCVLYGDDGEKFGEWPGTYQWVYKKKWLYNFLKALSDNGSWLKTEKIGDYIARSNPQGRVYIPTASYQEMSEWSLPADASGEYEDIIEELKNKNQLDHYINFLRGGFWRDFFVKYPESNHMHKRMMLVSERLHSLKGKERGSKRYEDAKRELLRSQCNCAYWHGVFGGLYLYHLRSAIYQHLIKADSIIDAITHSAKSWIDIEQKDFDCDAYKEFIVNTPKNTIIIDPQEGGTVAEWDLKERPLNIVNTLSRRKEAYHRKLKALALQKVCKDELPTIHDNHYNNGIDSKQLSYDSRRRSLFIDNFIADNASLDQMASNSYQQKGDFADGAYRAAGKASKNGGSLELERSGWADDTNLKISKRFTFSPNQSQLNVRYKITNLSDKQTAFNFAPELNLSLTKDNIEKEYKGADSITLVDKIESLKADISFSERADRIFRYPVNTVSQSEKDIEENYQASCVVPVFRFELGNSDTKEISIDIVLQ